MLIRKALKKDAQEIIDLVRQVMSEVEYFPEDPEEFVYTQEEEEEFIENIELFLVCEDQGKLVGSCTLMRGKYQKIAHTANFGITIIQEYANQGIGSKMLEMVIKHAKKSGIERIELDVFEENTPGLKLYRKYGFIEEGKKVNAVKSKTGYHNVIQMARFIKQ